ncbi:MAG: hypothetical protein E7235_04985 [Lachnospiraceae bacterium]|nr:hypothetical protein [Lachnospiraceae bacterium]
MNHLLEKITDLFKSRLFIFFMGTSMLFLIVFVKLYDLQIVNGQEISQSFTSSITRTLTIPASRGNIYDRYGKVLAENEAAFAVKIDNSAKLQLSNRSIVLSAVFNNLEKLGSEVEDTLPMTTVSPRAFTIEGDELEKWLKSIGLEKKQLKWSADEVYEYLIEKYAVSPNVSPEDARKIITLGMSLSDKNLIVLYLSTILELSGEKIIDEIPISDSAPYNFLYDGNEAKEISFQQSIDIKTDNETLTAYETLLYMEDYFGIPSCLEPEIRRNMNAIDYLIYQHRYRSYQPITIATNVNNQTVAAIEENNASLPGIIIDTDSLRIYNYGKYISHLLGYTRKISDTEYEQYKQYGYTTNDIVGKSGIEKVYELDLNGTDGEMLVEVDAYARRINSTETVQPVSGKDVYLTIDIELQKKAYDYLEDALTDVMINKLTGVYPDDEPITVRQFFISMIETGSIDISSIVNSTYGEQFKLRQIIADAKPDFVLENDEDKTFAKETVINALENGSVSLSTMVLVLCEQEKISYDDNFITGVKNGTISPLTVVINCLKSKELTPADTNLDPSSGSIAVQDVNSGEMLAIVTYPSYDNNEFVNSFNIEYYTKLLEHPGTPLVNRPLSQKKAPGSTFKMITAAAALETGAITPSTTITDEGVYKKAGTPYPRCWKYSYGQGNHGPLNVSQALEVSCNYFFYEAAFRMGNAENGTSNNSISTLNEYMMAFGLDDPTGVEVGETSARMATPEYKEYITKWQNPEASAYQTRWTDGDTIRAAIGQSVNNYTPAQINKYVATLANGGTRYKSHIVSKVVNSDGSLYSTTEEFIENNVEISDRTLNTIYDGMYAVTTGENGTLRNVFNNFPIKVAAKSGTAEEGKNRSSHVWFTGFAPYDDPQIAVTVLIPFGDATGSPAAVVARNIVSYYMGMENSSVSSYLNTTLTE